jgi:hypothetical protein
LNAARKVCFVVIERLNERGLCLFVAQILAQGYSETEIAQLLHVHVNTISTDVKVLKELSQRFVLDLAKGDLTYYYKQYIDEIDEIRHEALTSVQIW